MPSISPPDAGLPVQAASQDPGVALPAVAALRRLCDGLERAAVARARALGWSWQDIAGALGVTKQTVHRKHRRGLDGGQ